MTTTSHDCKQELKGASLKVTPARLGVLEILENSTVPVDVRSIFDYLEKHNIRADLATVFRIINVFVESGIAKSIQLNEGKFRYEYAAKAEHHHFICENCGLIEDISDCNISSLEKELRRKKGFLIKKHSLEFFGLCKKCSN